MTPDQLVASLQKTIPNNLRSVVLYGSAAVGDHAGKGSDYNILVLTWRLDFPVLKALSATATEWTKSGNPPPLLMTAERLKKSTDVFPIELLDIQESHKVLYGEDLIKSIVVSAENLRLQVEQELQGKLIQLRERFLLTQARPGAMVELMIESLSTCLVLFRAALRLFQKEVPQVKMEALNALSRHIRFDVTVFRSIAELKAGSLKPRSIDAEALFERYLENIKTVVDAVDAFIHQSNHDKGDL